MNVQKRMVRFKHFISIMLTLVLLSSFVVMSAVITEAAPGEVLILERTVTGGMASKEALAVIAVGKTPVVVNDATWSAMTAADFASYDGIVLGDSTCTTDKSVYAAAAANANVWGPVVDGNIIIIGSDPVYHFNWEIGAQKLVNQGMEFALAEAGKTGAYLDLSCYYHWDGHGTPVPFLDGIDGGGFTVVGADYLPGLNDVHITASHPALAGLTDADLSNWGNSVHEGFETWPVSLEVLAVARDVSGSYTAPDGTVGYPYILARGVTVISDIYLAPETAVNPVQTSHELTATVTTDEPVSDTPVVGTMVSFEVIEGPHLGTSGTGITDGSGQATFSYVGTAVGVDTIEATFVDGSGATQRSNRVTKEWTDGNGQEPEPGPEVGGDIYPANKIIWLAPAIVLAIVLFSGTLLVYSRRKIRS